MLATTTYQWFLAGHILAAVIWVGGGTTLAVIGTMTLRMKDPHQLALFAKTAGLIGERLYTPMSLLVLLFGIGMIHNGDLGWDYTWLRIALAGWALTTLVGIFWIRPTAAKLAKTIESKGPDDPESQAIIRRVMLVTRLDVVLLLFIVFVMTAKPWS